MTPARKSTVAVDSNDSSRKTPVREKAKRTRANIIESATAVFIEKGYSETRVADIVEQAGVAHGSFYTYFDSKTDVFESVAAVVVDEMYEELASHGTGNPIDRIHAANRRYLELYEKHAAVLALIEQVATFNIHFRQMRLDLRQRFISRIERAVCRIYDRGEVQGEQLDARIVANALGGMVDNFSFLWFVLEEPFDRETALYTLDQIWVRALGLPSTEKHPS